MREEVGMIARVWKCARISRIAAILLSCGMLAGLACPSGSQGLDSRMMVGHQYRLRLVDRFAGMLKRVGLCDDLRVGKGRKASLREATNNRDRAVRRTTWGRIKADFLRLPSGPPRGKGEHH